MPKTPDKCVLNIVRIVVIIFFITTFTLLHSYRYAPIPWFIAFLFFIAMMLLVLSFAYYKQYHKLKGTNITPIKNKLRDLKEVVEDYTNQPNDYTEKELDICAGQLVAMMKKFLLLDQYIRVVTHSYDGLIGKIGDRNRTKIFFAESKGRFITPKNLLDLSTIERIERVENVREYVNLTGKQVENPEGFFSRYFKWKK